MGFFSYFYRYRLPYSSMKKTLARTAKHRVSLFAYVGIINTLIDIVLLNILRVITHTQTTQTVRLITLNLISASATALLSFYLNRRYVFKSHDTHNRMFIPFLLITLSSIFILQSAVIALALHYFDSLATVVMDIVQSLNIPVIQNFTFNFYEANIAKVVSTLASMVWNYTWYKKFVFRKPLKQPNGK